VKKNEFIKQIRQKYKMSQKKFAEYLEVSKSLIEKVEMGKIPATPENKYVKAVCALEGLDNEIFKFDEITDEILQEYELTKFSKAFRKFLYFYYGDFWNEEIEDDFRNKLLQTLNIYTDSIIEKTDEIIINIPTSQDLKEFTRIKKSYNNNSIIKDYYELMIILAIEKFQTRNFCEKNQKYYFFVKNYITNSEKFLTLLYNYGQMNFEEGFCMYSINFEKMYESLQNIDKNGLALTVENIKKLKEQEKILKIQVSLLENISPTDPKDKQICELLQYAPPAFKDKIIEKLLKFKDEVEDI
jgi:transcriptional regulator with XRE-family HTH domain